MTFVYRSQVRTGRGSRLENLCWLCDLSLVTVNIGEHLHLTAPSRGRALSKRVAHLVAERRSFVCDLWINQKSSSIPFLLGTVAKPLYVNRDGERRLSGHLV